MKNFRTPFGAKRQFAVIKIRVCTLVNEFPLKTSRSAIRGMNRDMAVRTLEVEFSHEGSLLNVRGYFITCFVGIIFARSI